MIEPWVGGVVILFETPVEWKIRDQDWFINEMIRKPMVKSVQGPLINSIIAITFEIPYAEVAVPELLEMLKELVRKTANRV